MSKSTRRPQQLYTMTMWLLSTIFAGFLIGLGSLIIADIPNLDRQDSVEHFVDAEEISRIRNSISATNVQIRGLHRDIEDAQSKVQSVKDDYYNVKTSFDNWLDARTATQSSAQNPDVIKRAHTVEAAKETERQAELSLGSAVSKLTQAERKRTDLNKRRTNLLDSAQPKYQASRRARELRIFMSRLALTLPFLLVGGWLLVRKRESAYWPLYRGFVLFALFAFFVELAPYLPSYGGYVRYSVGIALIFVAGHFIIRAMRRYLARKRVEESRSEGERRQSIEYETALKKITANTCPGCDRSIIKRKDVNTDFCVHCGIHLKKECITCGTRNISFHRFCLSCGTPSDVGKSEVEESGVGETAIS